MINKLVTTLYTFTRRGKVSAENKTYQASVFGLRVDEDSALTYEHLKNLSLESVKAALDAFKLDLCLSAIIGADVQLIQNASGGGIVNIIKARLMNDGIANKLDGKQYDTAINNLVLGVKSHAEMFGLSIDDAYSAIVPNLKTELQPDTEKLEAQRNGTMNGTTDTQDGKLVKPEPVAADSHADLDGKLVEALSK